MTENEKYVIGLCEEYKKAVSKLNREFHAKLSAKKVLRREALHMAFTSMILAKEVFQNIHKDEKTMSVAFVSLAATVDGAMSIEIEIVEGPCPICEEENKNGKQHAH